MVNQNTRNDKGVRRECCLCRSLYLGRNFIKGRVYDPVFFDLFNKVVGFPLRFCHLKDGFETLIFTAIPINGGFICAKCHEALKQIGAI